MATTQIIPCGAKASATSNAPPPATSSAVANGGAFASGATASASSRVIDPFQEGLEIALNMRTQRWTALAACGLLDRRQSSQHLPSDQYLPTARGRNFCRLLWVLLA
jgi:hypothetical protein